MSSSQKTLITEIIGIIAGVLTASSAIPQVVSIFKYNVDSISMTFLYLLLSGTITWLIYAVLLNVWRGKDDSPYTAISLIIFQCLSLTLVSMMVIKLRLIQNRAHLYD
jgi:uncharacterized protein with PQ loop repeat